MEKKVTMMNTKIAVIGSGANGTVVGTNLIQAGYDVTLIDQWPKHVEKMRKDGATIIMPDRTEVVPVDKVLHLYEVAELTSTFDTVLLSSKAYDAKWMAQLMEPYLKPDGLLIGVQNGMTAETIADVVGKNRTLGCVIEISSGLYDPGIIYRDTPQEHSWFAVGSFHSCTEGREQEIVELLSHVGTCEISKDILASKWMKLVYNCSSIATTSMLGLNMEEARHVAGMDEPMLRAGQEAMDVGDALGYKRLPIMGLTKNDCVSSSRTVEAMLARGYQEFILTQTKAGILQDWEKGRRSEAWNMNGYVVEKAVNFGIDVPVNKAIMDITKLIESHKLKPKPENARLLYDLVESYKK